MDTDPRAALAALIEGRGEDYAGLSRLLGRNPAYIQQYIKRGTPRRLAEQDRRRLAGYFGVDESLLGGPEPLPSHAAELVRVPRLDVGASAGAGALVGEEPALGRIGFDRGWLRSLGIDPDALSLIRVEGDSMSPTLADGDEILVQRAEAGARLRDGVHVLRIDNALVVKRVAVAPGGARLSVTSDNPAYPSWPDCDPGAVELVGRVVWVGRRLA
jgi:phage repressor protein C with HTH and peptisase S24 domain